jgi:hypothetical protein
MSALTSPVLINRDRAYWLSSISNNVTHSTITTQEIDANLARFSTVYVSDFLTTSSLNASSFSLKSLDLSEGYISTLRTNNTYTSSLVWASDLSGGSGSVLITTDPSGVKVTGDPIVFGNLVYFTSTINLVPVSTIVDTDIFSSNAYFSTMSSGNISTGNIRATNAAISSLFVSSITAGDISGYKPSDWSLYPTLNSSITFNAGTQNILSNVGNKLYFAGNEITDLSGGGANWSAFPAQQDVSMNNFSIRALSTLQYNDGARLYSQTGNNLFYNGQPINYGNIGNAANWSFYPASTNVVMTNYGMTSATRLPFAAPQVSTVVDQGLNLASVASYDVTVQNGNRGVINLTANGGNNNGIFGSINLTANGATLSGVGATGGLITLTANTPTGTPCNATSAIKFSAAGINSYAGAIPSVGSLAGYNFIYGNAGVNIASGIPSVFPNIPLTTYLYGTAGVTTESTFYVPQILPYFNGVTTPPDLVISGRYIAPNLAQVYLQLSNVKYIYMDGAAQIQNASLVSTISTIGRVANFTTGQFVNTQTTTTNTNQLNSINLSNTQSTVTSNLYASAWTQCSTVLWNYAIGLSSVFNNIAVNNIKIADDITGVTNAPMPLQSRILNISTINSFNVSTTDLWVSSINGQPIDISGSPFVNSNKFSTLFTSSFQVSSMSGEAGAIKLQAPLQFSPASGLIQCQTINVDQSLDVSIYANRLGIAAANTTIPSLSTQKAYISTLGVSTLTSKFAYIDVSTNLLMAGDITIPAANVINFVSGAELGTNNLIGTTMPCVTVPGAPFGCNLGPIAANQFYIGSGTGAFGAAKLYCDFPGDNWGVDIIDAAGGTIFETLNCYDTGGVNYQTNVYGVSSIVGYTANTPGAQQAVGVQGILTANEVSTTSLKYTSTCEWYNSNTDYNYPLVLEQDTAGNTTTAGVAMKIIGHSFQTGAARHELHMGYRASDAANFITAVWPGQNLEDLSIEGDPVKITDGAVSTIFNQAPYALQTTGGVAIGQASGIITLSTGLLKVGGQTNLTPFEISTTFINTPYGNNLYYAGYRQPNIQWGTVATSGGSGNQQVQINTPYYETISDYVVQATMADANTAQLSVSTNSKSSFTVYWSNGGGGSHNINWTTFGNLPFTG